MTLLALVHFCEHHGPTVVMTTQIASHRCLRSGLYSERHDLSEQNTKSCENCDFIVPAVPNASVPVLRSSQIKSFPPVFQFCCESPECGQFDDRAESGEDDFSSSLSSPLSPSSGSASISDPHAHHRRPPGHQQSRLRKTSGSSSDSQNASRRTTGPANSLDGDSDDVFADFRLNDYRHNHGVRHLIDPDSPVPPLQPVGQAWSSAQTGDSKSATTTTAARRDAGVDDVSLESTAFLTDTPMSASVAQYSSELVGSPGQVHRQLSFQSGTSSSSDVGSGPGHNHHHHEIEYVSTKDAIVPSVRAILHNICIDVLSVESHSGALVSSSPRLGCSISHRFDLRDDHTRGGVRKYALIAWTDDARVLRPLETTILTHFTHIAKQIAYCTLATHSLSNKSDEDHLSPTTTAAPSSSLTSWLTSNPFATGLGSFLASKGPKLPVSLLGLHPHGHSRAASASTHPLGSIPVPKSRSLADIMGTQMAFVQLHSVMCPLLSLMVESQW